MSWIIKMLIAHKRLRGLSEAQLLDLIRIADDKESLDLLKQHLEAGSFKFPHLDQSGLIRQCIEKAQELHWLEHAGEIKRIFLEQAGDLL
ncbi:hypothetical protein [Gorillibacterium sp. sgz5001074]|uniref:hypothetical protein n=1 Tax=Gorillibacterium sp. sgz5001074 TaxID=3446695 RepID=UPI003F6767B2